MGYNSSYYPAYTGKFDSIPRNGGSSDTYEFTIYKKGNVQEGVLKSLTLGGSPVVHTWLDDSAKPYIKGSEVTLNILNLDGLLPLDTFYSENDDEWKLEVYCYLDNGSSVEYQLLFSGYLVQEDCSEVLLDIGHEINLKFTDNLGFLKNIRFSDAMISTPKQGEPILTGSSFVRTQTDTSGFKYLEFQNVSAFSPLPVEGDTIIINGLSIGSNTYTILKCEEVYSVIQIYVNEDLIIDIAGDFCTFESFKTYKSTDMVRLLDIYWILIYSTGIPLNFTFVNMLSEESETPPVQKYRILEYVYIATNTFVDNNNSDTLDTVLEKLNYRFSSTLFQSNGIWCLVRWNELRNAGTYVPSSDLPNILNGDFYSTGFYHLERKALTNVREIGDGSDIESGVLGSIERPLKFIEHDYKYSQNDDIPFNGDLNTVGNLLREYTQVIDGKTYTYKEYEAIGWRDVWPAAVGWIYVQRYIRAVIDEFGNEQDRYLIIDKTNGNSDDTRSVCSEYPIELNKGDKLRISFEWRTATAHNGSGRSNAAMPGLTTNPSSSFNWYNINNDGVWRAGVGNLGSDFNDDWDEWKTVEATTQPIPFDGVSYITLPQIVHPNENFTYIKNIKIEYLPYIAGQFDNEGHQHKTIIPPTIKNTESEEIFVDDTVKNYSKGTLFLSTINGVIRRRTITWNDGRNLSNFRLGEIIVRQEHLWRNKRRLKLEGVIWPVVKDNESPSVHLMSMINVLSFGFTEKDTHMIFGKLEIDYKENQADFTAYEMWKKGEEWYDLLLNDLGEYIPIPMGIMKDPNMAYIFKYLKK